MMSSNLILDQICSEYGHPDKLRVRNAESVNQLIEQIIHGGASNLQVITDFDFTLSKHHTKETKCSPAADIIRHSSLLPDEFKARARTRYDKLLPIELDPDLTIDQKIPAVIASFQDGFADLVSLKMLTKNTLHQMIVNSDDSCCFDLRDNCHATLQSLHESEVPVLIFSAGFGDVVQGLLQKYDINYPNIHVIANLMDFNKNGDEDQLIGFKEPLIHTFNKNETVIPQNCQYFDELAHRANVILLGDMIGDASMADGVQKPGTLLKIGFLNEMDEQQLEIFLNLFDIVLLDDQTMDFVNCLLKKILCQTKAAKGF